MTTAAPAAGTFQTVVRADRPSVPTTPTAQPLVVSGEALRGTAGTLGDPFRIIGLLPGVSTPLPMLPMFAVRGGSPGMSGFFIDGMRVPQLFHMLIGGGVIHPGLVDRLEFHAGGYDVTYGRQTGGIAAATTRAAPTDRHHLEAELRLLDVALLATLTLPGQVRVSVSGRYGYPGLILRAVSPDLKVDYWDYQLRVDWRGFTLQALGSWDTLDLQLGPGLDALSSPNLHLSFHRLQLRKATQTQTLHGDFALIAGIDQAGSRPERGVRKLLLGTRGSVTAHWSRLQLYAAVEGELSRFAADGLEVSRLLSWTMGGSDAASPLDAPVSSADPPSGLGDIGEARDGVTAGAALQIAATLWPERVDLTVGGRVDVYSSQGVVVIGFDPRAQLRLRFSPWLSLRVAGGVYQQPPSFPISLPGIDTFALQLGLQRALHATVTETIRLPRGLSFEATGYYQSLSRVGDLPPLGVPACTPPPSDLLSGATASLLRLVDGDSHGLELLLRRDGARFTGWVAYTLSRSERSYPCGLRPSDYDQTHVANVVTQLSLPRRFRVGVRLYVATGRPQTQFLFPDWSKTPRNNIRLPDYAQLDLHVEKEWVLRRGLLTFTFDLLNSTFSESALMLYYSRSDADLSPLATPLRQPQVIAFRWLLPSLGLRLNL